MNDKTIRITLVCPYPPPVGGIALWASRFMSICQNYNISCSLVNTAYSNQVIFGDKNHITLFKQYKRCKRIWNDVKSSIQTNKTSLTHICIPGSPLSILREIKTIKISKKFNSKTIVHFRSDISQSLTSKISIILLKRISKLCDGMMLLNERSYIYANRFCSKEKLAIIPNFILDSDFIKNSHVNKTLRKFIYVGGAVKEKGCNLILDYAKLHPEYSFTLVGNSSTEILNQINQTSNVTLLSNKSKDEIIKLLRESDIFLFLSKYKKEGFSNAVIEAMSNGLPCIVTKWASNEYQIGEYSNILSIRIDNINDLEKAVSYLSSLTNRKIISEYNLNRSKLFSASVVMNQYYNFYSKVLK